MHPDWYYTSDHARWVIDSSSEFTGREIIVDDDLRGLAIEVDPKDTLIRVQPGLGVPRLQYGLSRTALGLVYPEAVPELRKAGSPLSPRKAPQLPAPRNGHDVRFCPHCRSELGDL